MGLPFAEALMRFVLLLLPLSAAAPEPPGWAAFLARLGAERPVAVTCCRVCQVGKACGDGCIAQEKLCEQPPGCACDG